MWPMAQWSPEGEIDNPIHNHDDVSPSAIVHVTDECSFMEQDKQDIPAANYVVINWDLYKSSTRFDSR